MPYFGEVRERIGVRVAPSAGLFKTYFFTGLCCAFAYMCCCTVYDASGLVWVGCRLFDKRTEYFVACYSQFCVYYWSKSSCSREVG
jgi:hypothetical protein